MNLLLGVRQSVVFLVCLLSAAWVYAEEIVISDDGRQIQLNGDGSWVQLSADRYAINAAGERIRLKPDGTWSVLGEQVLSPSRSNVTPLSGANSLAAVQSTLFLAKVEILKRRIKRAESVHAETRSIYYLRVINDGATDIRVDASLADKLVARSSSGMVFPISSVEFEDAVIVTGQHATIRIEAEGSPQWFGVKTMVLEVAPNALGNSQTRLLNKSMDDVERRSVDNI